MHGAGIRSSLDDGGTLQSPKPKPLDPWSRALTARDRPLAAPASLVHVHRWIVDRLDLPGAVTGRGAGLVAADGTHHQMVGLLGLETSFAKRRMHLGYRLARPLHPLPGQLGWRCCAGMSSTMPPS
mgnify:CR=1 FL=1